MLLTSLATIAGFSILSKAYWNTFRPEYKQIDIEFQPTRKFNGELKILHLTDIHIEKLSVKPEKVLELVKDEEIDFIALTGDYLDRVQSIDRFIDFMKIIMKIPTKYGVYAVWGNHDWIVADHLPEIQKKLEALGVVVLSNETHVIEENDFGVPLQLIGIDDRYSGHADVEASFRNVTDEGIRIILTHDPLVVKDIEQSFDYLICGHFHSGQIYYPLPVHSLKMGLKPFKKYLCGLQEHEHGPYYISGGLGQTGANLRLGCRPEVTMHILKGSHSELKLKAKVVA
ncbi:metallophosphoesterase [Bacillus horti]|uniref:MPP superfamily phosphohydrolase n=1 Tax=Caldalkalibacillus horti TaxID=77523 RepID=A0ABT9VWB5_9BACI|nr:metallophosphoesterase [Bacillus horti]MDQ0165283.1 putative MPP superfamily phosphohydrolase [Bacillus horti]